MTSNILTGSILLFLLLAPTQLTAGEKIYHPYVEQQTYEVEFDIKRNYRQNNLPDINEYRLGLGKDFSEKLFFEFYLAGQTSDDKAFEIDSYELEAMLQIAEQGEYWLDLGWLVELERNTQEDTWQASIGLLMEKELGQWSATLNLFIENLLDHKDKRDWQSQQGLQFRYRYSRAFEPAIEIYRSKGSLLIGPAISGKVKLGSEKFNWHLGWLKESRDNDRDRMIRVSFEYEFN